MSTTNSFIPGSLAKANNSNVPVGHLDYSYVKGCTNAKELEEIIHVLRSGSEGYYPDLVEFTEKKLEEINPKSEVLHKDKPAPSVKDLDDEAKKAVTEDFLDWVNQANDMDVKLKDSNAEAEVNNVDGLPPVRSKKTFVEKTTTENVVKPSSSESDSKKRVKPRDYKEWDKFDINKELENVDKKEESTKPKVVTSENGSSIKLQPVSTKDLKAEERLFRATKEKEKGNEAFRAQSYDEALIYYTNSLKYEPTAASYNNRAAAELKIEKYSEAIEDCNKVLELEPNNLKAFVRRGMAFKALKQYEMAEEDFNSMLRIEPSNKRAKDLLAEIQASKRANEQSKPEVKNVLPKDDVKVETGSKEMADAKTKKKGQRLKIVEIDSSDDVTGVGRADTPVKEPGNEQNGLPDEVEEKFLETTGKGILEDINVVNGVKHEQQGLSMDGKVNSWTLEGDVDNLKSESNLAGVKESGMENGVDRCLATESVGESMEEPTSKAEDSSSVSESKPETQEVQDEKEVVVLEIPEEVKSLTKEGNDLYKMGHHSEALEKFSKCVEHLWPDRESYASAVSSLLNNKAACYFKMGDCKQCVLECNQSLQLVDNNVKTMLRRGVAYETMEKYAEAFRDFNRVRLIDGSNKMAQDHCSRVIKHLEILHGKSWRKEIFEMSANDDSNNQKFPNVVKTTKHPSQVQPNLNQGSENKTLPQKTNLQPDNSQNAGKTGPESGVLGESKAESGTSIKTKFIKLKESGNLLVKKGKHEEAIPHYTDCIKLCPEEVAIYTNRALCYLQLAKYDLAEEDCNAALKIQTDNIKGFFRRAKARKGLGRYREASDDLVQVLKLDSKNSAAKSELTVVLDLLKKEKKDGEKSVPKRKKISIQDINGDNDKKSSEASQKQSNVSTAKRKEIPSAVQKDSTKAKDTPPENIQEEDTKTKKESNIKNTSSSTAPVKYNLKSAFQFFHAWKSVKSSSEYLSILKQVNLADLPKIMTNKLDADMIKSIFEALHMELTANGDVKFVYHFLKKLVSVDRFDMTLMFLSNPEKEALRRLFENITRQNNEQTGINSKELSQLRQKYQV